MLKKRILTGIILITLVVLAILFLPSIFIMVLSALVLIMAAIEWIRLLKFDSRKHLVISCVIGVLGLTIALAGLSYVFRLYPEYPLLLWNALLIVTWGFALWAVIKYPKGSGVYAKGLPGVAIVLLVLLPLWVNLVALDITNPALLLYILALVWMSDIGAYFVGKKFGKHLLIPKVSPGKTWEGVLGACLGGLVVAILGFVILQPDLNVMVWLLFNLFVVFMGILGDLFESVFKRSKDVKDSGKLLPGHGGVLDRIDSLMAALPLFSLGLMRLGS